MNYKLLLTMLLFIFVQSAYSQTRIYADHSDIVYVGRISYKNRLAPKLGYTGAQIHANFSGTSLSMVMKPGSGYYTIELDDRAPYKVQSTSADSVVVIARGLAQGSHRVTVTQCNEAVLVHFPTFHGFILDEGATLLPPPALPQRRIEFIGNSITSALGILDVYGTKTGKSTIELQDHYQSYCAQVARKLGAQYLTVSRSGIGVYRNNGGNKYGDPGKTMQAYYPHATYSLDSEPWDFSLYTPDVVCINLGTNDTAQEYVVSLFTEGMVKFVKTVHGHYPKAKIVLLTGTMRKNQRLADLKRGLDDAVARLKTDGIEVSRFDFTPDDGTLGYGTGMHPSLRRHTRMADELTPYLKQLMGW